MTGACESTTTKAAPGTDLRRFRSESRQLFERAEPELRRHLDAVVQRFADAGARVAELVLPAAYAEIHVTKVLWPDFRRRHLFEAILDFQSRDRRYGGLDADKDPSDAAMFVEADE